MGIIPAYAGSTNAAAAGHLHVGGSSPHTRGARYREIGFETIDRIIPAYAGSTAATGASRPTRSDHPRIRGEHNGVSWIVKNGTGSSPHTRGARC